MSEGESEVGREVLTLDRLTSRAYVNIMRQYLVPDGANLVATGANMNAAATFGIAGSKSNGGVSGSGKGNLALPSLAPTQQGAAISANQLNMQLPQPPIVAQTQSLPQKSYQLGQQFGQMNNIQHQARVRAVSPAPQIARTARLASPFKQQQQPASPNPLPPTSALISTTSATAATAATAAAATVGPPIRQRSSTAANISSMAPISASLTATTIQLETTEKDMKPSFKKTIRHITSIFVNNNNNGKQQQEMTSMLASAASNGGVPPVIYSPPSASPTNPTPPPGSFAHLRHASSASSAASTAASAELAIRSRFQIKVADDDGSSSFTGNGGPSEWFRKFTKRSNTPPPIVFSNNRFRSGSVKSRSSIKSNGTTKSNATAKTYTAGENIGHYYGNIGDDDFALMVQSEMHPLPPGAAVVVGGGNLGYSGYSSVPGTNSGTLPVGGRKNLKHSQSLPSAIA
ncbi:hypothetical protein HK100_006474 [Physocladia obscura]|uniref:Uncharacterized protein n=1 Tax=Physocladia obscura TaxID=109957 RepID=A0AAD5TC34_9FUNG|nr:hypothetical protein HK100_006474 [Physocladia obscura]